MGSIYLSGVKKKIQELENGDISSESSSDSDFEVVSVCHGNPLPTLIHMDDSSSQDNIITNAYLDYIVGSWSYP